jgi:hypothetical protein
MVQRFVLDIELGNDAMQTPDDVREALQRICHVDGTLANLTNFTDEDEGNIRDANGNRVGKWYVR